jgi:hypothetical protein
MELTIEQSRQLTKYIELWSADKGRKLELETTFGVGGVVDSNKFLQIAQRLRSKNYNAKTQEDYLNILTPNHLRFSLYGLGVLQAYCRDDTIQGKEFTAMIKDRAFAASNLDLPEYDVRFKVRREEELSKDDPRVLEMIKTWNTQKKAFRLIRRWSFEGQGFRIDLSMVRQTHSAVGRPDFEWVTSFLQQNLLRDVPRYEVEVELLHDESTNTKEKALRVLIGAVGEVMRAIQKNTLLIRNSVAQNVRTQYAQVVGGDRFRGVGPVTLEKKNMTFEMEENVPNVRTGYNVTDKADGLRAMGFVTKEGDLYLLDQSMNVYRTGLQQPNCALSLVDGEWVTSSKDGKPINHYLIFDIYHDVGGKKVSSLPFAIIKDELLDLEAESRYRAMTNWFTTWKEDVSVVAKGLSLSNQLLVAVKHFEFASPNNDSIFKQKCSAILNTYRIYHTDGLILTSNSEPLPDRFGGRFDYQFKWKPSKDNTVDFMVYFEKDPAFPAVDRVSTSIDSEKNTTIQYKTMKLYVGGEKIPENSNPRSAILMDEPISDEKDDSKAYYQPILFNPLEYSDTMASTCFREIIVNQDTLEEYVITEDTKEPITHRSIVEMRYEPLRDQGWRWVPSRIRHDKTERLLRAIAHGGRIKYTSMMNDEKVANSVWNSIHDPITESMIRTGNEVPLDEEKKQFSVIQNEQLQKQYYDRTKLSKKDAAFIEGLQKFHNSYIKNDILLKTTLSQATKGQPRSILDFACGKGGDINKWLFNGARYVVGLDSAGENITNPHDGAYKRYVQTIKTHKGRTPKMAFIIGDSSKLILDGSAGANEEEADMLRSIFGRYPTKGTVPKMIERAMAGVLRPGVDVAACMFALHYFFEKKETLDGLLKNIADTVKVGGYFVGCCFDGDKVFNLLKSTEKGQSRMGIEKDVTIWSIRKEYDQTELTDDEYSLGLPISVEFLSIGSEHTEYLVSFEYLIKRMREIGFRLLNAEELKTMGLQSSTNTFDTSYSMIENSSLSDQTKKKYKMSDSVKQFSFLNRWFIFKHDSEKLITEPPSDQIPSIELAEEKDIGDEKEMLQEDIAAALEKEDMDQFTVNNYLANSTRKFAMSEIYSFGTKAAITKDLLGVKDSSGKPDLTISRWLALSAPFPIPDPDLMQDRVPVYYPSVEHYLAAMKVRFASNKSGMDADQIAISTFSTTGGIHQEFQKQRAVEKITPESEKDFELLTNEMTRVRQVISRKGNVLNKMGIVFNEARWDAVKDTYIAKALKYRLDYDDRFANAVEIARNRGKYLIYSTKQTSNANKGLADELGGSRDIKTGMIVGENKVGRILMKLAGFRFT